MNENQLNPQTAITFFLVICMYTYCSELLPSQPDCVTVTVAKPLVFAVKNKNGGSSYVTYKKIMSFFPRSSFLSPPFLLDYICLICIGLYLFNLHWIISV